MSIRFPDLQILFPRAADAGRVQPGASDQAYINLHAQRAQVEQEREQRRNTLERLSESERAMVRREKERGGRSRHRRDESEGKEADTPEKGRRIDVEA